MKISGLKTIIAAVIIAVLFIPSISFAFGSWSQETTARELCFLYTLSKDWQQNFDIADKLNIYREEKPILGSYPDKNNVNICVARYAATQILIPDILKRNTQIYYRRHE